jgi:hypothetical protein
LDELAGSPRIFDIGFRITGAVRKTNCAVCPRFVFGQFAQTSNDSLALPLVDFVRFFGGIEKQESGSYVPNGVPTTNPQSIAMNCDEAVESPHEHRLS